MARSPISKRLRFEVFKRDGFVCQYCGKHPPDVELEVDHIIPVKENGRSSEDNLVTACFGCNRGKSSISLSVVPKSLEQKALEIEERESQLAGYRAVMEAREDRIEADAWRVAEHLEPGALENGMRNDRLLAIKNFNKRLSIYDVIDAADMALSRKPYSESTRFKYFCGICWNKVRGVTF